VDRWGQRLGRRLRALVETWDDEIKRLLCEMGYFELLDIPKPPTCGATNNVTFVKFIRGTSDVRDKGKLAKELRVRIEGIVGAGIKGLFLFDELSEAITNVGQHAYLPTTPLNRKKQWWLSASYDRSERKLVVIFYDQGEGIPNTLPIKWASFESVKAAFNTMTDSQKIAAAMEYGRTSTFHRERGKGLQNLVEFARAYDQGTLSVYSLSGLFRITPTQQHSRAAIQRDHQRSIGGTLIEWSVKL
jgi:hypothetical protein